jgi:hypothetical protein
LSCRWRLEFILDQVLNFGIVKPIFHLSFNIQLALWLATVILLALLAFFDPKSKVVDSGSVLSNLLNAVRSLLFLH